MTARLKRGENKKLPEGSIELATSYFCLSAIVGVDVLDFCVRDGNRYFHIAVVTRAGAADAIRTRE